MARMIPEFIRSDAPSSERRMFERLRNGTGTEEWIVLHSVGLWNSYSGAYGEADFVIMIPGTGIVCAEVKGGGVHCRDGIWWTTPAGGDPQKLSRSPFDQAKNTMWKLFHSVREKFGELAAEAQCPFGWIVILPDVACPPPATDFGRGDVIDMNDLRGEIAGRVVNAPSIRALAKHRRPPNATTVRNLLAFLRPDFDRVPTAGSSIGPIVEYLNALTEEQYGILDSIAENERSIVQDYVGTGKTTLAVELARRATAAGASSLLLCFNRMLGEWLQLRTANFGPGRMIAGPVHQILRERIVRSSLKQEFQSLADTSADYWNEKYYLFGAVAITELAEKFDLVLIDEAQDFPISGLMVVVGEWLANAGRTVLFGDFARQAIYEASGKPLDEARAAMNSPAMFRLHMNCRNTRRIAKCNATVCELDAAAYHERLPEGTPVTIHLYEDTSGLRRSLNETVKALQRDEVRNEDIVVLGRYQPEKSSLSSAAPDGGQFVRRDGRYQLRNGLAYHTIHSFKGMECAAVLVVDIDDIEAEEMLSLLYVGISRAKVILHIFMNQGCGEALKRKLGSRSDIRTVAA